MPVRVQVAILLVVIIGFTWLLEYWTRFKNQERARKAIKEYLKRQFVEHDPTPACFDYNNLNMSFLLAFIRGVPNDAVREHLIQCSRCRYIYSTELNADRKRK